MSLQVLPPGWQQSQLDALNQLEQLREAYLMVVDVIKIAGPNQTADTSAQAVQVKADIVTAAVACWTRVKTYPGP